MGLGPSLSIRQSQQLVLTPQLRQAIQLLQRHGTLEATLTRARHYGAMAQDALALFPESAVKRALHEVVEFVASRRH